MVFGTRDKQVKGGQDALVLRYLTPHGKWNIHSTYQDNERMLTLFRGGPVVWLSNEDADEHGINDNDWLEVYNRNGVVTARAVTSQCQEEQCLCIMHKINTLKHQDQKLQILVAVHTCTNKNSFETYTTCRWLRTN